MRKILFRGKRVDTGTWEEGIAFPHDRDAVTILSQHPIDGSLVGIEVIPESVGQYIGKKDRKGTWIFEGDVLIYVVDGEYDVNEKYLVVFDDDEAAFKVRFYYKGKFACYDDIAPCEKLEIIGNIHDNPELLKGEGNG